MTRECRELDFGLARWIRPAAVLAEVYRLTPVNPNVRPPTLGMGHCKLELNHGVGVDGS
jgi:hypothetical protein